MCSWGAAIMAVVTLYAADRSASAQKKAGEFQNQVAVENKKIKDVQAQDAMNKGAAEVAEQRMRTRLAIGAQRATIAANNVDLQTGSALDILGDTALFGAVDERRIRENSMRQAWGARVEGQNSLWQGQLARFSGKAGAQATYLNAASNIAGYGASAYGGKAA